MLLIPKGQKPGRLSPDRADRSDHVGFACSFGCAICGQPAEPHHLLRVPEYMLAHSSHGKYAGSRSDDMWIIPLCRAHHIYGLHRDGNEPRYLARFGIDGLTLARSLWSVSGNEVIGALIVEKGWHRAQRLAKSSIII